MNSTCVAVNFINNPDSSTNTLEMIIIVLVLLAFIAVTSIILCKFKDKIKQACCFDPINPIDNSKDTKVSSTKVKVEPPINYPVEDSF